jgi:hypothetical protein
MPSISIWLNSEDYKHLEELAKLLNRKPSKVIKEILEDKISFKGIENYYSIVKELYKWYYYEGNGIPNEKYSLFHNSCNRLLTSLNTKYRKTLRKACIIVR